MDKRLLAVAIAAVLTPPALADELIEEITILGDATAVRNVAGSAHVLDAETLERFEFADIHQILQQAPGVYVLEEEGFGLRPNIGIRGSGSGRSSRITLMEDGVLLAPAPYSNPAAYYFPSAGRIRAVEVLKGPQVLEYGPFTVGGVVNLVSTPIPDRASGFLNLEGGEDDEHRVHGWYGGSQGNLGYLVEGYVHGSDGFKDVDRSDSDTGFDKGDYVAKVRWRSDPSASIAQHLQLKVQYSEETSEASYVGLTDADFDRDPNRRYGLTARDEMDNHRTGVSLHYRAELSPALAFAATAYRNDFRRDWFKLDSIGGDSPSSIIGLANRGDAAAQAILDGTADVDEVDLKHNQRDYYAQGLQGAFDGRSATGSWQHDWTIGARVHEDEMDRFQPVEVFRQADGTLVRERIDAPAGSNNRIEEGEALSLWAVDRLSRDRWNLVASLRYEDVETERVQYGDPDRDVVAATRSNETDELMAGFGVTYDLTERWLLLAGFHQGFAPPGGGAEAGTDPEESRNWELGARFTSGRLQGEVIGFYSDFQNTVLNCSIANPCSGGRTTGTESLGESEITGLEVAAEAELLAREGLRVPLRLSYTYTDAEITESADDGSVLDGDVLQHLPEHLFNASLGLEASRWALRADLSYVDDMCIDNSCGRPGVDDRFLTTDAYWVTHLFASWAFAEHTDIYARVENLFDEEAIVARTPHGARPNKDRTATVGLRVRF